MSRQKFQTPRWTVVAFLLLLTIALVPFPARAQTQITYAVWGSPEAIPMWERDIALFEAAHPDIRVNLLFSSWDQYWERMPFYLSGEIEVDVIQLGGQHVTAYASQGLLLPLTPYVESGELDLEPYFPQVAAIGRYNDTLYAFPDTFSPVILYFNIDLFEAYGLETPYELYLRDEWTWEAFESIVSQLTLDTDGNGQIDQWGQGTFGLADLYVIQAMILSNGGRIYNEDFTELLFTDPKTLEALEWLAEVGRLRGDWNGWYNGRVGMMTGWPSSQRLFPGRVGFRVGVAPLPGPSDGQHVTVMTTNFMSIVRHSKNPDAAVRFIRFITGDEVQRARIANNMIVSAHIGVARETLNDPRLVAEYNPIVAEIADFTVPWAVAPVHWEAINALITRELQRVERGEEPVTSAAIRITELANVILKSD